MKNDTLALLAGLGALALLGVYLARRRAAAMQQQEQAADPMAWITEWGKNGA